MSTADDDLALPSRATKEMSISLLGQHDFSAVLWDWDGVLVDSRRNFYGAYEMVLREAGIATTPREIFLREGEPTPVLLRAIFDGHHIQVDDDKIKELVIRRRKYDASIGGRKLFPAVPRLLQRVRRAGCRNGLVTGSSKKSLHSVLQTEQARWFDTIVTADDVTKGKPDPEPFLRATQTLQTDPQECLVIENAPFGIEAARSAGCAVVAICSTLSKDDLKHANWVANNHDGLEALLFGGVPRNDLVQTSPASGDSP
jgi:beta-phosphoglucomutase